MDHPPPPAVPAPTHPTTSGIRPGATASGARERPNLEGFSRDGIRRPEGAGAHAPRSAALHLRPRGAPFQPTSWRLTESPGKRSYAEHRLGGLAPWPRRGWADPPASPGSVRVWFLRWEVVGRRRSPANSRPPGDPSTPRERKRGPALFPHARSPGRSRPGPQARAGSGFPGRAGVPRIFAFSAAGKRVSHDSPRWRQPDDSLGGCVQGQLPVQAALLTKPIGVADSEDPAHRRFTQPREEKTRAPPQEGDVPLLGQVSLAQPSR